MSTTTASDAAKAVVRRNTEEVPGKGNFDVFEELFANDFVDHTTQPGTTPDKAGVRKLYAYNGRSQSIGVWPTFCPSCNRLAGGLRLHLLRSLDKRGATS